MTQGLNINRIVPVIRIEEGCSEPRDQDDPSVQELNLDPFNIILEQLVRELINRGAYEAGCARDNIYKLCELASRLGEIEVVVLAQRDLVEESKPGVIDREGVSVSEGLVEFAAPSVGGYGRPKINFYRKTNTVRISSLPDRSFVNIPYRALAGIRLRQPAIADY